LAAVAEAVPVAFRAVLRPLLRCLGLRGPARSSGVLYGANSASWLLKSVSGTMWFATLPIVGPPQAWTSDFLSMIQFIAFRTWMSSNGACVRFIVRYHVRSPENWCSCGLCWRAYFSSTCEGGVPI